jgi:hypothetical protein
MRQRRDPAVAAAEGLVSHPDVAAMLEQLVADKALQKQALARPEAFLARQGVELPPELSVKFGPQLKPKLEKPGPDWMPFSIRLTRCRTFWIRDPETKKLREENVCFGIEITRNPIPGGPIG